MKASRLLQIRTACAPHQRTRLRLETFRKGLGPLLLRPLKRPLPDRSNTVLFQRGFSTAFSDSEPNIDLSETSSSWKEASPRLIFAEDSGARGWKRADWEKAKRIYRLGRPKLSTGMDQNDLEDGVWLIMKMIKERIKNGHVLKSDKASETVLDDPWLLNAWSQFIVYKAASDPASIPPSLSYEAMIRQTERCLGLGILAWNPLIITWILDALEASKVSPDAMLDISKNLTLNHSTSRPINKYVVTRMLKLLAAGSEKAPETASELVGHLRRLSLLTFTDSNHQLDVHVYSAWVNVWVQSGRPDSGMQALKILQQAQQDGHVTMALYNTVMTALCRSHDAVGIKHAQILWKELLKLELPVTAVTWTPLFQEYLHRKEWRKAVELWRSVSNHQKTNVRPHHIARDILHKFLERDVMSWKSTLENTPQSVPESLNWNRVADQWESLVKEAQDFPSHLSLARALLLLDFVSLAALEKSDHWKVPSVDMDKLIMIWRRLSRRQRNKGGFSVSQSSLLNRLQKYQGIGLLQPAAFTLDWMIEYIGKTKSPSEAAELALKMMDLAVEDCNNNVHHPAFVDNRLVTRLIKLWGKRNDSLDVVEKVYDRLLGWYEQSGRRKNLEPDEDLFVATIRAMMSSSGLNSEATAERAAMFWRFHQKQLEQSGKHRPSVDFRHIVATALAEAGRVDETKEIVTEIVDMYMNGKVSIRKDLDFLALIILAHCRAGPEGSLNARKELQLMEDRYKSSGEAALQPSSLCYDHLLLSLSGQGNAAVALQCLYDMVDLTSANTKRKLAPSRESWKAVSKALSNSKDMGHEALALLRNSKILEDYFGQVAVPDTSTYNLILRCLLSMDSNAPEWVAKMESIVKTMENSSDVPDPDEHTYDLLLEGQLNAKLAGRAASTLHRFVLLSTKKKGFKARPCKRHFHAVMKAFLSFGDTGWLDATFNLLKLMQDVASTTGWSVHPDRDTFSMVIQSCKELGADPAIVDRVTMMILETEADTALYGEIIGFWVGSGRPDAKDRILWLAGHIDKKKLAEDTALFHAVVDAYADCDMTEMVNSTIEAMAGFPDHYPASLEALIHTRQYSYAAEFSEKTVDMIQKGNHGPQSFYITKELIKVWKESKVETAGTHAENLLECTFDSEEHDSQLDSSVFADVLLAYLYSRDPNMLAAVDRIQSRHEAILGTESFDLSFLEAAISIHLHTAHDQSARRVCELLQKIPNVPDRSWLTHGKDVCGRLKDAIVASQSADNERMLASLADAIESRMKKNMNVQ